MLKYKSQHFLCFGIKNSELQYPLQLNIGVDATRFPTPEKLALALKWYQNNPEKYLKLFDYRKNKLVPKLKTQYEQARILNTKGIGCRLCACKVDPNCMAKRNVTKCRYLFSSPRL